MMNYNAAIIGCGNIGCGVGTTINENNIYTHAGGYVRCPRTELAALCDTSTEKIKEASQMWNVGNIYPDIDSLFEYNNPDIVSVCTPDNTHYKLIKSILKNYPLKCIFAEKPLALNSDEARELVDLAEDNGVLLVVNYSRRFDQFHQNIKKELSGGIIGAVQTVNGYYTKGTFHNGTHWLDLARFLFGEVCSVTGYDHLNEKSEDPTYDVYLNFTAGFSGYLHSCDYKSYAIFEMDILGTEGRIRLYDLGHCCDYYSVESSPYYAGYQNLKAIKTTRDGMKNTLLSAISSIVRSLDNGTKPECLGYDGFMAVKIAEAVSKSVKSGNSQCTIF